MKKLLFILSFASLTMIANAQWQQTNGPCGGYINCLAISGTNIFAGTNGGVILSTNNGSSWSAVNTGLPPNTSVWSLAISGTIIFAGTLDGVFLSTDNGSSWIAVNIGLPPSTDVYSLTLV